MNKSQRKRKSFKNQLLTAFAVIAIIPVIFIAFWSYSNTTRITSDNVKELTDINLKQTSKSVETMLESYGDLLYQIYTDENIVELTDSLTVSSEYDAARKSQLIRALRTYANAKAGIQGVTVIVHNSDDIYATIFYDMITGGSTKHSWKDNFSMPSKEVYQTVAGNTKKTLFSTEHASELGETSYYLFHLANRIVDYRDVEKKNAVVVLSIDEEMINQICNQESSKQVDGKYESFSFVLDEQGQVISYPQAERCGETVSYSPDTMAEDLKVYVADSNIMVSDYLELQVYEDETTGWTYVNVSDQGTLMRQVREQQRIIIVITVISSIALILSIAFISNHLTSSISNIVDTMKKVEEGNRYVRVENDDGMSIEIGAIADRFNHMIQTVNESVENEKEAVVRQKNAEVAALEAQINPHFLYNILDTINWMAIEKDEFEISNTINALAKILRYGIEKSNSVVEIQKEVEWLKQYVFLQQIRLKNSFQFILNVDPEIVHCHIHKLIFQPFVENAIIHGFEGVTHKYILELNICEKAGKIEITIRDNGKGMPLEKLNEFREADFHNEDETEHIGVGNALGRIKMYYGEEAEFMINSKPGVGTEIILLIPKW